MLPAPGNVISQVLSSCQASCHELSRARRERGLGGMMLKTGHYRTNMNKIAILIRIEVFGKDAVMIIKVSSSDIIGYCSS